MVDGKANPRYFLVAGDRYFNSLKAEDHLAFILEDNPYAHIFLAHAEALLGGDTKPDMEELNELWGPDWCGRHLHGDDAVYAAPEALLLERGFPAERIIRLPATHALTAHGAILKLCVHCGTLVIGRRRLLPSRPIIRRVSAKVLEMARETAVWLV